MKIKCKHDTIMQIEKINIGEIYGKQTSTKFAMYHVLKVNKNVITLQNIDNPLSLFETTAQKLTSAGYVRVSQTPYVDTQPKGQRKGKMSVKASRCPFTTDFFEQRADSQRPEPPPVIDLFSELA